MNRASSIAVLRWIALWNCRFAILYARFKPTLERRLRLPASSARDQSFSADVFVEIRPFDGVAATQQSKVGAFNFTGVFQTRIPRQRDCQCAPISEGNVKSIALERHIHRGGIGIKHQSSHATLSQGLHDFRQRVCEWLPTRDSQNRDSSRTPPAPARFRNRIIAIHMNMRRLGSVRTEEHKDKRPDPHNGRNSNLTIPSAF